MKQCHVVTNPKRAVDLTKYEENVKSIKLDRESIEKLRTRVEKSWEERQASGIHCFI